MSGYRRGGNGGGGYGGGAGGAVGWVSSIQWVNGGGGGGSSYVNNALVSNASTALSSTSAGAGGAGIPNFAPIPAGDGGTGQVVLTFDLIPSAPTLTSVAATSGPQAGGGNLVITGTGLTGATAVTVGGTACTSYTVDSATQITCVLPSASSAGAAAVQVTTPGGAGTLAGAHTYVAAPAPSARTSTGAGTDPQSVTLDVPDGGTVTLLSNGSPATTVTVDAQEGTYTLDPQTGAVTFTAVAGFHGTAQPVHYRVTDAYGQSGSAVYTPSVTVPPPPTAPDRTTSGVGTAPQTATLPVPPKGNIALLDENGNPTTSLLIPQKGTYTLSLSQSQALSVATVALPNPSDQAGTAVVTFTPVLGFHGMLPPINYTVTDAYGQTDTATYTPAVSIPAPPAPPSKTTTGGVDGTQTTSVPVPEGGSIHLVDARGHAATLVSIARQGVYVLQPNTGTITFVPEASFSGRATAVRYVVVDAYGQAAEASYTAVVGGATLAVTGLNVLALVTTGVALIPAGSALITLGRPRRRRA
ncbi:IPT/TIG domain-containing protein [Dactylosporangium sp. NPDC051541]|uniref:IPT/TIG domain-containing protein n=1 Tax=Dactylosporangium sp. NPDC051541 TaxID=3363977 RepID=UPI00379A5AA4